MIFEIRYYIATSNKDDSSLDQFPFLLGHPVAFYREFEVRLKQILKKFTKNIQKIWHGIADVPMFLSVQ